MRLVLALLLVGLAPDAAARSWIARSYAGLLRDAHAVVTGQVGEVSHHGASFRVETVLSGDPALAGQTVSLPVVRCNEPGPDGIPYTTSTCLDRTYPTGERLLLLLTDTGEGLREIGYPEHSRARLSDDAVGLARALLALPDDSPQRRAAALGTLLVDPRAADPWLTLSGPRDDALVAVYQGTVDRLTLRLHDRLRGDPSLAVRTAAAATLGHSRRGSLPVTQALLTAAASPDPELAYAAVQSLAWRADPRAADALLALALDAPEEDRQRSLLGALAPVVRTDHADALARLYRAADEYAGQPVLDVWVQTGDGRAADEAARLLSAADEAQADDRLRTLAYSRDRRYAQAALGRLRPVTCDEQAVSVTAFEAAAMLALADQAVPALAAYFSCATPYVRWKAVQGLRRIDLPSARAALVAQWRVETDDETREAIEEAVGRILPDEQHP